MKCPHDCPERSLTGEAELVAEYCGGPIPLLPNEQDKNRKRLACPAVLRIALKGAVQNGYPEVRQEIVREYQNSAGVLEEEVVIDLRVDDDNEDLAPLRWEVDEAIRRAARDGIAEVYQHSA